jgi:hypothetical protein
MSEEKKQKWLKLGLDIIKLLIGFLAGSQL